MNINIIRAFILGVACGAFIMGFGLLAILLKT